MLDLIPPIWTLTAFGLLTGAIVLLVFRGVSNPAKIRAARTAVIAHLLEMRLYNDQPLVVLRAQRGLLLANLRYVGQVLIPSALVALPLMAAYPWLDDLWGHRPLAPGSDVVITASVSDASAAAPRLAVEGDAVRLTSTAVRAVSSREVSWRLRALKAGSDDLVIETGATRQAIPVHVGSRQRWLQSTVDVHDPSGAVRTLHIPYDAAGISALGIELPWEAWFLIASSICALALRRRFGVQF